MKGNYRPSGGPELGEYALILVVITLLAFAAISLMGTNISSIFSAIENILKGG